MTRKLSTMAALLCAVHAAPANALETGTGAYLLGSRDSLAGIAPPPGFYFSTDIINLESAIPVLPIGGVALTGVTSSATVAKLNFTRSFQGQVWGGQPYLTVTVPVITGQINFAGELNSGLSGTFSDEDTGFGDLTITPAVGYHAGNAHWVYAVSVFAPTGYYEDASIDIATRNIEALSFSKNRWAITPTIAYTNLNPATGLEFSASGNVTFSAINEATDYQTAPEGVLEAAVLQHIPSGWAFGVSGYAYQQFGEDSGSGAEQIKAVTGAESLEASVLGLGPIVTYSTQMGGRSVSFEAKYVQEFNARRRFESDVVAVSFSIAF